MRIGCKAWPTRLIATAASLALVLACTFGAYAHAAGHRGVGYASQDMMEDGECADEAPGHVHTAHTHVGHTHVGHSHVSHGQAGHQGGDTDKSNADGCNALCHGVHAILAAAPVIPPVLLAAPPMQPEIPLDGAVTSGLERPPRTSVPA